MTAALLVALLLQAAPAAEGHPATAPEVQSTREAEALASPESAAHGTEAGGHGEESGPAAVIMHHVTDQTFFGFPSKHLVFFVLAALLVVVGARLSIRSYRGGWIPHGLGGAVEALVLFIRDEVAEPSIGHGDGRKFTPLLCSFFFFILVAALLGLVPLPSYEGGRWSFAGTTSTGNIAVTMALAGVSFLAQQYAGISKYGVLGHFKNLIPEGLPLWLLPIMIPVEIISMFTKPFALMIRLFANMLAGHMVITTLLLLIALMGQLSWGAGVAMTPVSITLGLFIMLLEILVAFIQAYIFTLLSALFIGMYAHPAH
ncbi:MAG: F0F1 ATP synthase subunit A [Acidobacteria bacterium]|nr:F0F1 ATP synthase subunit A [Acidobacteriota bacterium]